MSLTRSSESGILASIPRQRDARRDEQALRRAVTVIGDWLEMQDPDDPAAVENVEELWRISRLALAGAPEAALDDAVRRARQCGWEWAPMAVLLAEPAERTRERVNRSA
jgi:hypothetical protein